MILLKPCFDIIRCDDGNQILRSIEIAGRTCYKSEHRITSDSARAFVAMIIKRGHETVIEHEKATVRIVCDRGVSHEIVRHRLASYSQESTRYCDYSGGHISYIIPPWTSYTPGIYTNDAHILNTGTPEAYAETMWAKNCLEIEALYKNLREVGWKPEQARSVLPNSLKTEIVVTANLREWRHFFRLRTAPAAHPQMREIAVPLLAEMKLRIPVVFDDIELPAAN